MSVVYGNRFLAITTTLACISICQQAIALTSTHYPNPIPDTIPAQSPTHAALILILFQLRKQYTLLVDQSSAIVFANLNDILPIYTYGNNGPETLSALIATTITIAMNLNTIIQSMTVASSKQFLLSQIQQRILAALLIFQSLALPTNQLQPPQ